MAVFRKADLEDGGFKTAAFHRGFFSPDHSLCLESLVWVGG